MDNTIYRDHLLDKVRKMFEPASLNHNDLALEIFEYQYTFNHIYNQFCKILDRSPHSISSVSEIPFLPIELFKNNSIKSGEWSEEKIFRSSGTTQGISNKSNHYIKDIKWYEWVSLNIWNESFESDVSNYEFYGLLPSYLERQDSSLVHMVNYFIKIAQGDFYLNNISELVVDVNKCLEVGRKIPVVFGVSFALLDLVEMYKLDWAGVIVIETGGMKGRRKEITRNEMHEALKNGLNINKVYSEYGMTELLSQSYSKGDGIFDCSKTMRIIITDSTDPLSPVREGKEGLINVIDLANLDTCSFLGTNDLGKKLSEEKFTVTGRFDNADIRGCNLMVSDL